MKLLVCTNNDLVSLAAMHMLLPHLKGCEVHIVRSPQIGGPNAPKAAALLEQGAFDRRLFAAVRAEERFAALAAATGGTAMLFERIGAPEVSAWAQALAPDAALSLRFGQVLREDFIASAKGRVLNLHSGALPGYRGIIATFWALLAGKHELTATLHHVRDAGLDTGDVVAAYAQAVTEKSQLGQLLDLYEGCMGEVAAVTRALAAGEWLPSSPQRGTEGYFSHPQEADMQRFFERGFTLWACEDYARILARCGIEGDVLAAAA